MRAKTPNESRTVMTDLVLPSETNPLNNLFGGELLARMDRAASIAARRHSRRITVTASVTGDVDEGESPRQMPDIGQVGQPGMIEAVSRQVAFVQDFSIIPDPVIQLRRIEEPVVAFVAGGTFLIGGV